MVEGKEQDREPGPKKFKKWWKSKTESQGQRSSRNGGRARQRARAKEVQEMVEEQDREPGPKKFKKWWRVKSKTESQGQRSSRNGGG